MNSSTLISAIPADIATKNTNLKNNLNSGTFTGTGTSLVNGLILLGAGDPNFITLLNENLLRLSNGIAGQKSRIDTILSGAGTSVDTLAEIVAYVNSIDLTNDNALASYISSNNATIATLTQRVQDLEDAFTQLSTTL